MNKKHKIGTIINFCSNEIRFIKDCIEQAKQFSENLFIVVADHFFDGRKENINLLETLFTSFPDITFIVYPFFKEGIKASFFKEEDKDHLWHSISRYIGYCYLAKEIEYVLFLDVDEIVEAKKFLRWLDSFSYKEYDAMSLANYWYFRSSNYRAKIYEDSPVLIKKKALTKKVLLHKDERLALLSQTKGKKKKKVCWENLPMIHHYSWVRSKEEMLKKVNSWGHKKDRDWPKLVEEEFSRPFSGKDFIHGYEFETVQPFVLLEEVKCLEKSINPNIIRLDKKQFYKLIKKNFLNSLFKKDLI